MNHNNNKSINCAKFWTVFPLLLLSICFIKPSYAHRGAVDEIDNCRFKVGFEKIHFTAYTPTFTQNKGYCQFIPDVGVTNLVFDYEGRKLRNITIEFEITKEPEGTRIFYQEPKKIKTGTVNAVVDFSQFGAGDYLAHVAIVHKGEKLDSHLPFTVGSEESKTPWGWYIISIIILFFIVFLIKLSRSSKKLPKKNDESAS